jgi:hypothetical protein
MTKMSLNLAAALAAAALTLAGPPAGAQSQDPSLGAVKAERPVDFESLSSDLQSGRDLFAGGNGKPVTFDAKAAAARGLSPEGIQLARELAEYTNALVAADGAALANSIDVTKVRVDMGRFPLLASYLDEATVNRHRLATEEDPTLKEPEVGSQVEPQSWLSEYICGAFWRPRPSRAAPWVNWWTTNPHGVLTGWGYHTTPSFAGGGYTRPQTYSWALCGFSTYRDHAYITGANTFREQTYAGWTPRGEPNPEVWRSGPWPYAIWPAYVRWWHQEH